MTLVAPLTRSCALDALDPDADGRALWRALGAGGAIAAVYRDGDPGRGVEPGALGRLLAEVDRRFSIGATLAVCVPLATCLPLLRQGSAPAQVLAEDAMRGTAVVALAATDDVSGCDLTGLHTTVEIGEHGLVVNGTKQWITNATTCDAALVLARHREGRHFTCFTWVLVPTSAPGVRAHPADTDLFTGSGTGHLSFDRVRLDPGYLVGGVGRGLSGFAAHISVERLAGALWAVAICRRVLADTKLFLQSRGYHGETLWHLEGVRQRFAAAAVLARQHHALTQALADKVAGERDATCAALLKASAALTLPRVLDECAHLQGAEGFARGGAQRLRAEAALWGIGGGTTEVVLSTVAGAIDPVLEAIAP